MDSLLANYASSDDEDKPSTPPRLIPSANPVKSESRSGVERHEKSLPESTLQRAGILNSLPPPKSSIFNSLPSPKSKLFPNPKPQPEFDRQREVDSDHATENPKPKPSSSSLFSSLPLPKSSSSASAPRKVVQFRPPAIVNPVSGSINDEDEDSDQGEQQRKRKKSKESVSTTSATSFLSSIPAPRHSASLGSLPGRRSMLESDAPPSTVSAGGSDSVVNTYETNYGYPGLGSESENHDYSSGNVAAPDGGDVVSGSDSGMNQVHEVYDHSSGLGGENSGYYDYCGDGSMVASDVGTGGSDVGMNSNVGSYEGVDYPHFNGEHVEYTNYDVSYGDYGKNVQYENNWANNNMNPLPEVSGVAEAALRVPGRRGRKDVPPEIIEVSQDELMKNRPREDQVKSTGIAFGPAYQPAPTKGKPNKLHKRKHQIGSLYFDMRQKEMELNDRRSKGFLTKAQTQAKYGW